MDHHVIFVEVTFCFLLNYKTNTYKFISPIWLCWSLNTKIQSKWAKGPFSLQHCHTSSLSCTLIFIPFLSIYFIPLTLSRTNPRAQGGGRRRGSRGDDQQEDHGEEDLGGHKCWGLKREEPSLPTKELGGDFKEEKMKGKERWTQLLSLTKNLCNTSSTLW